MAGEMMSRCGRIGSVDWAKLASCLLWSLALATPVCSQTRPSQPAARIPDWLPRYDLNILLDVAGHEVRVQERVRWTNPHKQPTSKIVFNVHAHYSIPDSDVGFLAKMLEVLRLAPSEVLDFNGPAGDVRQVMLVSTDGKNETQPAPFRYQAGNATALEVDLPAPVGPGQSVTLDLVFTLRLPQKQGRWGQWNGVTFLAQWLPVVAYYDDQGWQPTPFIPWHQPFFNEAGIYTARVTLPADQKLASTGSVHARKDLGNGWQQLDLRPICARDFALFCSARFHEFTGKTTDDVLVRCLAFPEHEFYAREMVRIACDAIPAFGRWFGPFPYPEFTIVESYFGWNGNECGGLVMIDARIFGMPHLARNFVDYLVSHEICHQWWYNVVGTNGYAETWMDEGLATYFAHRLMNQKYGKNNKLLDLPSPLRWLPNIHREDYRNASLWGTLGRGEATRTVQEMPGFGNLITLNSMAYDRGSKIVGMIEERLGEAALFDFMRQVYRDYQFRILRVADFQRELEQYTGRSWEPFFKEWVHGAAMTDWSVEQVSVEPNRAQSRTNDAAEGTGVQAVRNQTRGTRSRAPALPYRVTVVLRQRGDSSEPTILGFSFKEREAYSVRIPIRPDLNLVELDDFSARVEMTSDNLVRVEALLPAEPTQVAVDPDQILLDSDPTNNCWKPRVRLRLTPLYTQLEESDLTNAYDRWNLIVGPWIYGSAYNDPWYTRSSMLGLRAGVFRTQEFNGGAYLAYRSNDRRIVTGVDALWDHWPLSNTQVGFNVERSLATLAADNQDYTRGVVFGRYVMMYGSSLYLPPFHYVELFGSAQNRSLPFPRHPEADADLFNHQTALGLHYHKYFLTPYWDPEAGVALDATYQVGVPILGAREGFQQVFGQISWIRTMPGWTDRLRQFPWLAWVAETRLAARLFGAAALPDDGLFFALGGGEMFRGFDLRERQGSLAWIGSLEWRIPLAKDLNWDCLDHVIGARNLYTALFYDAGNTYLNGRAQRPVAHALGAGLRLDVAWFGLIERTMFRFDVAKTINESSPWQFWFGIQHAF
jgi:hypothetical protein